MNIVLAITAYILLSFVVSGCASLKPGSPEARALVIEQEDKKRAEVVTATLDLTPGWFLEVPRSGNAIYASGTGVSPNLQLSVDKSVLNAKRTLADRLGGLMSSKSKMFVVEQGQGVVGGSIKPRLFSTTVYRWSCDLLEPCERTQYLQVQKLR